MPEFGETKRKILKTDSHAEAQSRRERHKRVITKKSCKEFLCCERLLDFELKAGLLSAICGSA